MSARGRRGSPVSPAFAPVPSNSDGSTYYDRLIRCQTWRSCIILNDEQRARACEWSFIGLRLVGHSEIKTYASMRVVGSRQLAHARLKEGSADPKVPGIELQGLDVASCHSSIGANIAIAIFVCRRKEYGR